MTKQIPFRTVLDALRDDSIPFPARYLHHFSDLTPEHLKALIKIWPAVALNRKRALLEDLENLAEADTLTSFDELAKPLLRDPDPHVRVYAIRLLWECEDVKLVPVLIDIFENGTDDEPRAEAATALGRFVYLGELEKIPATLHHEIEDRLLEVVQRDSTKILVCRRALEALGASSRPEVPALIEAAYAEKNLDRKVSALFAMGRSGELHWEKHVLSHLHARDEKIRGEAIRSAGELGLTSARTILLDMLEDEDDNEMHREIIWALSKIGDEGIRDRLEELLDAEPDEDEADFLEEALENLTLTEDLASFDMFEFEPDDTLTE